jgi:hypothetical protein
LSCLVKEAFSRKEFSVNRRDFVAWTRTNQDLIERDLNAFGPPDPTDPVFTALADGVKMALKQLRADTDRVICDGSVDDFAPPAPRNQPNALKS